MRLGATGARALLLSSLAEQEGPGGAPTLTGGAPSWLARSRAWRSPASSASAFSISWALRSRLTAPENLVISQTPVRCSSGTACAWPSWCWVGAISTRDFRPFSIRSRCSGLRLRQQASFSSHTQSSAGSVAGVPA